MARGDGSLILRGGTYYGRVWIDGRPHEESLRTSDPQIAEKRLAQLRRQKDRDQYLEPAARRVTVDELLDDLFAHQEARGRAGIARARSHAEAVRRELGHLPAAQVTTARVERLQAEWLREGRAPATVNRRLELLRTAFRLAFRRRPRKVVDVPLIPMLQVQNARQGFLSPEQADAVVRAIADLDVRDFVEWLSWTAMRPGEARQITWAMVDLEAGVLTLHASAAKTRHGRVLPLAGPLAQIIARRLQARRLGCQLVFHRASKGRRGQPVKDIRKAFRAACIQAGVSPDTIPYDLRRSALRNLVRAGTPETVAMSISGHRTRATFDRYNITSAADQRAAIERTAEWAGRSAGEPVRKPGGRRKRLS